jgi:hypothetical protein
VAPPLQEFRTWVAGQEVDTRQFAEARTGGRPGRRWYVKQVAFAAGQQRQIRDSYFQPNGEVSDGTQFFPYALQTGASWHGPIGSLTVRLHWAESWEWAPYPERSKQPTWERQPSFSDLVWSAREIEPDFNLRLDFAPGWQALYVDGYPVGQFGRVQVRPEPTQTYVAARSLAEVMQATCEWEWRRRMARFDLSGGRRYLVPRGSHVTRLDGHPLMQDQDAAYEQHGTLWVPISPILHALGWKWITLHPEGELRVETGGPVAWEAEVWGPERDLPKESLYLARQNGVLMGELRPLIKAIPRAKLPADNEHASYPGWQGDVRITRPPAHDLRLRWGKTAAWVDGKPYQLPAAPYISPADTGMVPVQAFCQALGLTATYSEENKTVTVGE